MNVILAILLLVTAIFLILLVLIQRGRGGGLAGAFGGMGGQSAFGTKAGDLFTRVTIGVAAFWIVLCVVSLKLMGGSSSPLATNLGGNAPAASRQMGPAGTGAPGNEGAKNNAGGEEENVPAGEAPSGASGTNSNGPEAPAAGTTGGAAAAPAAPSGGTNQPAASGGKTQPSK